MNIKDLFGLPLDQEHFDVDKHADLIDIKKLVVNSRSVKRLREENGANHPIVQIAKRQTILKHLKNDLESALLPYDPLYYAKEVNTAEDSDRKYGAEEKLLEYCLIVVCGKPLKKIAQEGFKPDVHALRDTKANERFNRYWSILADHTRETVESYHAEMKKKHEEEGEEKNNKSSTTLNHAIKKKGESSFWSKLFS